ncbi:MAG: DUF4907 domain-containing protein [Bacteroidia bacterium]
MITISLFAVSCIFISCKNQKEDQTVTKESSSSFSTDSASRENTPVPPSFTSQKMDMKTFEVKDTASGKSLGWGYDIYVDDHKAIHQPIIPGLPGNNPFKTEEQAKKTGEFVLEKMKKAGTLISVTPDDLDKLGITK